ncbi:MAG: OmpA family protein [Acidimicrobiia bacterium]|nr:OmpA family protein [Acidimicrobiia bacterium]
MTISWTGYRRVPRVLLWLAGLWLVVILVALAWGIGNAESKLREATRSYLDDTGLDVTVDIAGRDATLYGSVDSEEEEAQVIAAIDAIPGVRLVNSRLIVVEPPAPEIVRPRVAFRLVGNAVSLQATLADAAQGEALVAAAREQYGSDRIVDAIVIAENVADAPWLGRIKDVFVHLDDLRSGGFAVDDSGFVLEGEVISDSVGEEMKRELELVLGETVAFSSDLSHAVLPAPAFSASGSGNALTLRGRVPSQETVDAIADAARRLHPSTTITNSIRVSEVAGANWLDSIDGLLDVVTRLDPWTIEINEGRVTIAGTSTDLDLVNAIDVLAAEVVSGQLVVITEIQLDPVAVALQLTELIQSVEVFGAGEATVTVEGAAALDEAVTIIQAYPDIRLTVAVHTDDQGDSTALLLLSAERAEAVVAYLVSQGIEAERLRAIGYGDEQPIADNSTEEGRAENRRIEFLIEQGEQ